MIQKHKHMHPHNILNKTLRYPPLHTCIGGIKPESLIVHVFINVLTHSFITAYSTQPVVMLNLTEISWRSFWRKEEKSLISKQVSKR